MAVGPATLASAGTYSSAAVIPVPTTIPSDCSVDVTTQLNQWMAVQPNNSTLQLAANGCYQVDGHLVLSNRSNLTLDGNGATLKVLASTASSAATVQLAGGTDVTVENLNILGNNPVPQYIASREWSAGIQVSGTNGATINNTTIQHVYGDFVTISPNHSTPAQNVLVENSQFNTSGRQGISFADASQVEVTNVTLGNTANDTFDVESDAATLGVNNLLIQNTTSFGTGQIWFSAGGDSEVNTGQVLVRNNVMTSTQAGDVIDLWAPSGYTKADFNFVGNTLDAGASASVGALQLTRAANVHFDGNTVNFLNFGMPSQYTHEPAVKAFDSNNVEASGNTFNGPGTPLVAQTSSTVRLTNNIVNR